MNSSLARGRILAIPLVLAMFVAACGDDDDSAADPTDDTTEDTSSSDGDDGSTAEGEPILVGVNLSLSGPAAALGVPNRQAMELAVEQINEGGGIDGRPLELNILDDASDPERAATNTTRLVDEGVVAILGGSTGSMTVAMDKVTNRAGVLFINTAGPEVPGEQEGPLKYHVAPPISYSTAATLCWATEVLEAETLGLLHATDGWGQGGQTFLSSQAETLGIDLTATEAFDLTATDTSPQWTAIRSAEPDAAIVWASAQGAAVALQNAQDLAIDADILGSLAIASEGALNAAGDAAEGMAVAAFITAADPTEDQAEVAELYADEYGEPIDFYSAMGYDAVKLLEHALSELGAEGEIDSEALAQALEDADAYQGLVANFDYTPEDHTSVALSDYQFLVAEGGAYVLADEQPSCDDTTEALDL